MYKIVKNMKTNQILLQRLNSINDFYQKVELKFVLIMILKKLLKLIYYLFISFILSNASFREYRFKTEVYIIFNSLF